MHDNVSWTLTYSPILGQSDPPPASSLPATAPGSGPPAATAAPDATGNTATTQAPGTTTPPPGGSGGGGGGFLGGSEIWILLIGFIVIMYVFILTNSRKEKRNRAEMLAKLRKGVKVETVGGVIGTVLEVRDNELVIKVDENNNTRMRFARAAVKTVLDDKSDN